MNYFKDSIEELKKVTWPTRNHALKITIITIVFTFFATLLISGVDFGFRSGYDKLTDLSPKAVRSEAAAEENPIQLDPSMIQGLDAEGNPVNVQATPVPVQ